MRPLRGRIRNRYAKAVKLEDLRSGESRRSQDLSRVVTQRWRHQPPIHQLAVQAYRTAYHTIAAAFVNVHLEKTIVPNLLVLNYLFVRKKGAAGNHRLENLQPLRRGFGSEDSCQLSFKRRLIGDPALMIAKAGVALE